MFNEIYNTLSGIFSRQETPPILTSPPPASFHPFYQDSALEDLNLPSIITPLFVAAAKRSVLDVQKCLRAQNLTINDQQFEYADNPELRSLANLTHRSNDETESSTYPLHLVRHLESSVGRTNSLNMTATFLQLPEVDPNIRDSFGSTPLIRATRSFDLVKMRMFLDHPKTDPLAQDRFNSSALDYAKRYASWYALKPSDRNLLERANIVVRILETAAKNRS